MARPVNLAPVVLFCYNRPWHLRQTIEALQQNNLASESNLIIYSDGPKHDSDKPLVEEIRGYLRKLNGFQEIKIIEAERNNGLAASVIKGVSEVLKLEGKIIVLEDDMLTTPDFLAFMNEALDTYQSRSDVFSVTAYCPPIAFPADYEKDLFLAPRASSWGWGTWIDRWNKADWSVSDFVLLKKDRNRIKEFTAGGEDLWPMLAKQQQNIIDSWAIRWTYCQFKNSAFGVYPVRSKIKNIGTDGSGTNFTFTTGHYGGDINPEKIEIDRDIQPDTAMIKLFGDYYRLPFYLKIKNWLKYQL